MTTFTFISANTLVIKILISFIISNLIYAFQKPQKHFNYLNFSYLSNSLIQNETCSYHSDKSQLSQLTFGISNFRNYQSIILMFLLFPWRVFQKWPGVQNPANSSGHSLPSTVLTLRLLTEDKLCSGNIT